MVSATRPRLLNEPTPEETEDCCLQVHPGSHPQGGHGSDPQGRVLRGSPLLVDVDFCTVPTSLLLTATPLAAATIGWLLLQSA
jgi:hypothetical protein